MKSETIITPKVPQEIIDEILTHLATDSDFVSLRSCALVSKSWVPSCQRHLFHTVPFTSRHMVRWLETFPVPEESPAHLVKHLYFTVGKYVDGPKEFFEYTPWFTKVERVVLLGHGGFQPLWIPSFWRLPQSVTSLVINAGKQSLRQIQALMAQLPNLNDLSLVGYIVAVDEETLPGIETTLRGRFGGKLRLTGEKVDERIVDMLLGVPTGLHFTEVQIHSTYECLLSTVRLVEACSETLVKLLYMVDIHSGDEAFERSFDFSKLPNLREVHFGVSWIGGGLFWIPEALSTLRPTASAPRLLAIRLSFTHLPTTGRPAETMIKDMRNDLRRIADELVRIEREFEGAVELTVHRDPAFNIIQPRTR